jgi:hypothetical protein
MILTVQERARLVRPEHTQSSGPRQGVLGSSRRRVCERQAVLTAPPRRETELCAVLGSREPGLGREAAPDTSAPQRKLGMPPPPMPVGRLRRRQARRAPKGGASSFPWLQQGKRGCVGLKRHPGPSGCYGGPTRWFEPQPLIRGGIRNFSRLGQLGRVQWAAFGLVILSAHLRPMNRETQTSC